MTYRRQSTSFLLILILALAGADATAQEARLRLSSHGFTFADPSAAGIRSYSMVTSELVVVAPVRSWLTAGTAVRFAGAAMSPRGVGDVRHSGLTDTDFFVEAAVGRLRFRGMFVLPLGPSTTSSEANVVASLAGYELLRLPVRSWGTGGGYGAEVVLPVRSGGFDVELSASTRRHGSFEPFGDVFDYRLGAETRGGIRIGGRPTALSRAEVGGFAVSSAPDESLGREVFEPGVRFAAYGLIAFPIGRTSVLMRGDLHQRTTGGEVRGEGVPEPAQVLSGVTDTPARTLRAAMVETRTLLTLMPLTTRVHISTIEHGEPSGGWLASVGVGTELEVRVPLPGRYFVMPEATLRRGEIVVAEGYESEVRGWSLSLIGRWEAGR